MRKFWVQEEIEILQKYYPIRDMLILQGLLPGRSRSSIFSKADDLELAKEKDFSIPKNMTQTFLDTFVGLMLGDGCIIRQDNRAHVLFTCKHRNVSRKYKIMFEQAGFIFGNNNPYLRIHKKNGGKEWSICSRSNDFFTKEKDHWYKNGRKIVPDNIVLTPSAIRHWYYGDGSLHWEKKSFRELRFHTNCFSFSEVEFLGNSLCYSIGMKGYRIDKNNGLPVLVIRKSDTQKLLDFIGPCDLPCFLYKWIITDRELYNRYKNTCLCIKENKMKQLNIVNWLLTLGFAKNIMEAENFCSRGSVRVDGKVVSDIRYIPAAGSAISTLEHPYTVCIPEPEYSLEV